MNDKKNRAIMLWEVFINILLMTLIYWIIWFACYRQGLQVPLYKKGITVLLFIYAILYTAFSKIYAGFDIGHLRVSEIIYSQSLAVIIVNILSYLQICLIDRIIVQATPIVIMTFLDMVVIIIWSFVVSKNFQKRNKVKKIIVIHGGKYPADLVQKFNSFWYKFKISKTYHEKIAFEKLQNEITDENGIAIYKINSYLKKSIVKFCFERSIPLYVIPETADIIIRGSSSLNLIDMPVLQCNNGEISIIEGFIKRSFDIIISFLLIILFSPIMLLIALAIKLYDNGPIIFKQKRMTLHGKVFTLYKFRSMKTNAEKNGIAQLAKQNDNRITSIGKFIRRFRLDELPQFFNILKGDMSIVGPRPERPEIAEQYEKDMAEFKYRLKVKAGLTGYAQVLGRYNTTPYDKLMLDMLYIEQYSFLLDIKLIFMTIKILFMPESTMGFENKNQNKNRVRD